MVRVAGWWLASRMGLFGLSALVAAGQWRVTPPSGVFATGRWHWPSVAEVLWTWGHYDAWNYALIAAHGYQASEPQQAVWFPLYPLLIRITSLLLPSAPSLWPQMPSLLPGLIVSNVSALAAVCGLVLLVRQEHRLRQQNIDGTSADQPAIATVWCLLAYPLAIFLVAPWSDALFLALATFALWALRGQRWLLAAALCAVAMLSRPTGIILFAPLLWEYGRAQWHTWHRPADPARRGAEALWVVLALPVALLGYARFCQVRYGDPLAPLHQEVRAFHHVAVGPWTLAQISASAFAHPSWLWAALVPHVAGLGQQMRELVDILPLLFVLGVTLVVCWRHRQRRRWPTSFLLYQAGLLLLCCAAPTVAPSFGFPLAATGRYLLASIPVWLTCGAWLARHPRAQALIMSALVLVQAALAVFALSGGWLI